MTKRHGITALILGLVVFVLAMATPFLPGGVPVAAAKPPPGRTATSERMLRLESIEITGNGRTKDKTILSHIGLAPGDPIDVDVIEAARLRLMSTDYFSEVEFYTKPGANRGDVILVVEVEERSAAVFETGFGYHDLHGWFLTLLGVRFDNMFGVESRLRLGWRLGFRMSGIDAEWEVPTYPKKFGFGTKVYAYDIRHLFYRDTPSSVPSGGLEWTAFEQSIVYRGGEAELRYRFNRRAKIALGIKGAIVEPDSTFTRRNGDDEFGYAELPSSLQGDLAETAINGFYLRFIRDTRDDVDYPKSGSFALLTVDANTELLGSDAVFTKTELDVRKFMSLRGRATIAARVKAGGIVDNAPYYERFYLGGIYSIRGFEEWSLSPTAGDERFWLANVELRFPLTLSGSPQPRLTGLVFFDAGEGWQRDESIENGDVESAAGYGVRLRLPWVGTLGLDVGIPFTPGRTGDKFRVHASLGFSF